MRFRPVAAAWFVAANGALVGNTLGLSLGVGRAGKSHPAATAIVNWFFRTEV